MRFGRLGDGRGAAAWGRGWVGRPKAPKEQGRPMADKIFFMVSSVSIRAIRRSGLLQRTRIDIKAQGRASDSRLPSETQRTTSTEHSPKALA